MESAKRSYRPVSFSILITGARSVPSRGGFRRSCLRSSTPALRVHENYKAAETAFSIGLDIALRSRGARRTSGVRSEHQRGWEGEAKDEQPNAKGYLEWDAWASLGAVRVRVHDADPRRARRGDVP